MLNKNWLEVKVYFKSLFPIFFVFTKKNLYKNQIGII